MVADVVAVEDSSVDHQAHIAEVDHVLLAQDHLVVLAQVAHDQVARDPLLRVGYLDQLLTWMTIPSAIVKQQLFVCHE